MGDSFTCCFLKGAGFPSRWPDSALSPVSFSSDMGLVGATRVPVLHTEVVLCDIPPSLLHVLSVNPNKSEDTWAASVEVGSLLWRAESLVSPVSSRRVDEVGECNSDILPKLPVRLGVAIVDAGQLELMASFLEGESSTNEGRLCRRRALNLCCVGSTSCSRSSAGGNDAEL